MRIVSFYTTSYHPILMLSKSVKCIAGMIHTISGVILLSEKVFEECKDVNCILISMISQDALENTFAKFGSQENNSYPSIREVRHNIARISSAKILNSARSNSVSNCCYDEATFLDWKEEIKKNVSNSESVIQETSEYKEILSILNTT